MINAYLLPRKSSSYSYKYMVSKLEGSLSLRRRSDSFILPSCSYISCLNCSKCLLFCFHLIPQLLMSLSKKSFIPDAPAHRSLHICPIFNAHFFCHRSQVWVTGESAIAPFGMILEDIIPRHVSKALLPRQARIGNYGLPQYLRLTNHVRSGVLSADTPPTANIHSRMMLVV